MAELLVVVTARNVWGRDVVDDVEMSIATYLDYASETTRASVVGGTLHALDFVKHPTYLITRTYRDYAILCQRCILSGRVGGMAPIRNSSRKTTFFGQWGHDSTS